MLTQEKAAIKIQAGVRGLLTRRHVQRTAQQELEFIGMKPKVCLSHHAWLRLFAASPAHVQHDCTSCLLTTTKQLTAAQVVPVSLQSLITIVW